MGFSTSPGFALGHLRREREEGVPVGTVLGDAGYGDECDFRVGVAALDLRCVLGIRPGTSVWPPGRAPLPPKPWSGRGRPPTRLQRSPEHQPLSIKDLALSLPRRAWRTVTWREGSRAELTSRFAARRVRPAHRDTLRSEPWPEEWLLIEWPEGTEEPSKYWLSNLPPRAALKDLVHMAKARWLIERDYQELKQEIGLGHYEGGARLARLPPPRQPLHRGLWLPGGRAPPFSPSAPLCPPAAGTCATQRFPAARHRSSGLSATCHTRSPRSDAASPSRSSAACPGAHAAYRARNMAGMEK